MKCFVFVLLLLIGYGSFGQLQHKGVIQGKIVDVETGEGLPSAVVELLDRSEKCQSDLEGMYRFDQLENGVYCLRVHYPGFPIKVVEGIEVQAGQIAVIDVVMYPAAEESIEEIVITAKRITNTDQGVLLLQKNASGVSDVVSSQTIARSAASNTSDVLKMVSGASIQENKFAVIRGLNDRYNAAFLNGAPLPSSESDRKAFSFDMFPSNMLENMIIAKSATADQPAEFAGGLIQINTKSIPDKSFFSIQLGTGFNTLTTFKERVFYQGGKLDWLGVDDGSRKLPSIIPNVKNFPLNMHEQAQLAQKFTSNWGTNQGIYLPNLSFQTSGGFNKKIGKGSLGIIAALTYSKNFNYSETLRRGYSNSTDAGSVQTTQIDYEYLDRNHVSNLLTGALLNISWKINEKNQLAFKNTYSINSSDKLIQRTGEINPLEVNPNLLRSNARWFTSNQVYSGQLEGQHDLKLKGLKANWLLGYSYVNRSTPNLSRSIYTRNKYVIDKENPDPRDTMYLANISFTNVGPGYGGGMFFSENKESSINGRVDISYSTNLFGKIKTEFKTGYYNQIRARSFEARQLGYTRYGVVGGDVKFDTKLLYLDEEHIFAPENMGIIQEGENGNPAKGGFKLTDGTKLSDSYDASSLLHAAYFQIDNRFGTRVRTIYGVRMEQFNQTLMALRDDQSELNLKTQQLDFLPSLNVVFEVTKRSNIRLSYSQTLNRPEYRELAPFAFYDFTTNFVVSGNDSLERARIHNADLRYEVFQGRGQVLSATLFYKYFLNPIEQRSRPDVVNEISFQNALSAVNYGVELEGRILLSTLLGIDTVSILNQLTLYANLAVIRSKVDVSTIVGSVANERPLQGQSPYVFNGGVRYDSDRYDWGVSLNLNRVGQRIAIVGNVNEPDLWEKPRTFLDLQLIKGFWKGKAQVKLTVQNILAQDQIFYQNGGGETGRVKLFQSAFNVLFIGDKANRNGYNKETDQQIWKTNFGTTFSLSMSIKL